VDGPLFTPERMAAVDKGFESNLETEKEIRRNDGEEEGKMVLEG